VCRRERVARGGQAGDLGVELGDHAPEHGRLRRALGRDGRRREHGAEHGAGAVGLRGARLRAAGGRGGELLRGRGGPLAWCAVGLVAERGVGVRGVHHLLLRVVEGLHEIGRRGFRGRGPDERLGFVAAVLASLDRDAAVSALKVGAEFVDRVARERLTVAAVRHDLDRVGVDGVLALEAVHPRAVGRERVVRGRAGGARRLGGGRRVL
jgi:hypothetical protein